MSSRGFRIPTKNLAEWASELIATCYHDLKERRQLGARYRNIYLTGDEDGSPQTFKKVRSYIQNRASLLYSPVELRWAVEPYGQAGPRDRAFGKAMQSEFSQQIRNNHIDTELDQVVEWALVKGKTFLQLLWTKAGLEPYLIQPELMGVLRPDINTLDRQDAFVHSTWITPQRFAEIVASHPRRRALMANVQKYISGGGDEERPDVHNKERQVLIGGQLYPYRPQGTPGSGQGSNIANWLQGPAPNLEPKTLASLIRLDELWIWDWPHEDWATIQIVGNDCIINHDYKQPHNIIAEQDTKHRETLVALSAALGREPDYDNPLKGKQPFCEICPNEMPDYFWGYSEILDVGALQIAINRGWDGIQRILRLQEDPPQLISGSQSPADQIRAKLRRPGGWWAEQQAGAKAQNVAPELPPGLWESLHEVEARFDIMGGQPPVMQGRGESGVRAQAHAETLVRMAGARVRDQALTTERQIDAIAGLGLDMMRAHSTEPLLAWVKEENIGPFKNHVVDSMLYEPPAPGFVGVQFLPALLDDRYKVSVDGHSASPAFSKDERQLAFDLNARRAIDDEALIEATNPPHAESLIADAEKRKADQAALIKAHPEWLQKGSRSHH